jgi:putative acetyltransferase
MPTKLNPPSPLITPQHDYLNREWTYKSPKSDERFYIRPIQLKDDKAVFNIITNVLSEHGCIGEGYASNDVEAQHMSHYYNGTNNQYWVIADNAGLILGGGGFAQLKGTSQQDAIAELQKLYFLPALRGYGIAKPLLQHIEYTAQACQFKTLYLETVTHFKPAIGLYESLGYTHINHHLGATGHHERCTVRMTKPLG